MKKKIIGILVMMLLIATALSSVGTTTVQTTSPMGEVKDQYQEQCDECVFFENYAWQQFVPTMEELIRIGVNIAELGGDMDITLTVEKPLGTVLTSKTLPASSTPSNNCGWVSFDVPDKTLTTGSTYYIVLSYDVGGEYGWCGAWDDPYPQGDSTGGEDCDYCFRTFCEAGNSPPYNPTTPSGPTALDVGDPGTYTTSATDPDGDKVQYCYDWDADSPTGDVSDWTELVESGESVSLSHSWSSPGTYLVVAKARDEYGATSGWSLGLTVVVSEGECGEFMDFIVCPLGDALLDIDEALRVYNIGDSGDDGVKAIPIEPGINVINCTLDGLPLADGDEIDFCMNIGDEITTELIPLRLESISGGDGIVLLCDFQMFQQMFIVPISPGGEPWKIVSITNPIDWDGSLGYIEDFDDLDLDFSGFFAETPDVQPPDGIGLSIEFIGGETVNWTWEEQNISDISITKLMIIAEREIQALVDETLNEITASGMDEFTITEFEAAKVALPIPPEIAGPTSGKAGTEYTYTFTNPGTQSVYFLVDWDDPYHIGDHMEGTILTAAGGDVHISHTWEGQGDYVIRARAMNEYGMMSDWTELSVSMPRNKPYINTPFLNFLQQYPILYQLLLRLI